MGMIRAAARQLVLLSHLGKPLLGPMQLPEKTENRLFISINMASIFKWNSICKWHIISFAMSCKQSICKGNCIDEKVTFYFMLRNFFYVGESYLRCYFYNYFSEIDLSFDSGYMASKNVWLVLANLHKKNVIHVRISSISWIFQRHFLW